MIPTVISFILAPPNLYDIENKYETLKEATYPYPVSERKKGQFYSGCNLTCRTKLITDAEEVISDQDEENKAEYPCECMHHRPCVFGHSIYKNLHVNMVSA
jgi:hypothetical protein